MKKQLLLFLLTIISFSTLAQKDFYEFRVYDLKFGSSADGLHQYLENALIPALNKYEVENIGVFKEAGQAQPGKVYLLIPYKSMAAYESITANLEKDISYATASKAYNSIPLGKEPYSSLTTSFFRAFDGIPQLIKPAQGSMLFELRTYVSPTEDAARRKRLMFNKDEIRIFAETGLHSVFFGEQLAGPNMPNLTYLLAFKDMEERDSNWSKFGPHPDWNRIKVLPEYAGTVSNIIRVFLTPTEYSQL